MGLINALNIANTGLRTIQTGLNTVATNVAQAEVDGYRKQEFKSEDLALTGGVKGSVQRASDRYLENQYRLETARAAEAEVNDYYLSRIDQLFGTPGEAGAFDTLVNEFSGALEALSTSPDDYTSRQLAISAASGLADGLNTLSDQVQTLRQLAEDGIATTLDDINDALSRLENLNARMAGGSNDTQGYNELLNERDRQLARISDAMEIQVVERDNGTIGIYTKSGNTLLEGQASRLEFDHRGNVTAGTLYSHDDAERQVGTVTLVGANGYRLDLINNGILDTGRIGALIDMRDNVLVEAQNQLDALAAGFASALSDTDVDGEAVTSGGADGFDIDLDGLQQGNTVSLTYTDGGGTHDVTLVRVDDPALLPLSDDHTAALGDHVIGIDFSAGYAAAAAAINAELSPSVNVSALANGLRFLDDGAAATSDITAVNSRQTLTDLQDGALGMPLFVDGSGMGTLYTRSMEGIDQQVGFAGRISVNAALAENNELLVQYDSDTEIGDMSRPLDLIDRLNNTEITFAPKTGIGSGRDPYTGTVGEFARLVVSDQTGKAESASQAKESQDIVVSALKEQLDSTTGVDVDEELARLIGLQNSYAANARILQAVNEMMQQLMNVT